MKGIPCNHWLVCATLRLRGTKVLPGGLWPFAAMPVDAVQPFAGLAVAAFAA